MTTRENEDEDLTTRGTTTTLVSGSDGTDGRGYGGGGDDERGSSSLVTSSSMPTEATSTEATTTTNDGKEEEEEQQQPGKKKRERKTYERVKLPTPEEVYQQDAMDNCAIKTAMSCVLGGALGGVMGVVFGAFEPMEVPAPDAPKVKLTETIRQGVRSAGARSWSYAKGFAAFGALYAGSECVVEKVRAKHDVTNSAYAGCFTGGVMARSGGPSGMAFGCASMAALSVAMDKFMDHH
jgi:import inner membrane translocase subunit TIM22